MTQCAHEVMCDDRLILSMILKSPSMLFYTILIMINPTCHFVAITVPSQEAHILRKEQKDLMIFKS